MREGLRNELALASRTMLFRVCYISGDIFLDSLCPFRIIEGSNRFLESKGVRADAGYHDGLRIPSQRIFENASELTVPIRYMSSHFLFVFHQSIDAVSK